MEILARLLRRACAVVSLLVLCGLGSARAATWTSIKTNGVPDTLATAQVPVGSGALTAISGTISSSDGGLDPTDADVYKILINDPVNFSATVQSSFVYPVPGLDTELWLFNPSGHGVEANEDKGSIGKSSFPTGYDYTSWLPAQTYFDPYNSINANQTNSNAPTSAGVYYLAITADEFAPADASGNQIFPNIDSTDASFTDTEAPGSAGPLAQWQELFSDYSSSVPGSAQYNMGSYTINLTGATFAAVPEPSSILLAAFGLAGLGTWTLVRSNGRRRLAARRSLAA